MLKNLILLFAFSTFVMIVWVSMSIYHSSVATRITPANQIKIEPIEPLFDTKTLEQLSSREKIDADLNKKTSAVSVSEAPPEASESAVPTQILPSPTPEIPIP